MHAEGEAYPHNEATEGTVGFRGRGQQAVIRISHLLVILCLLCLKPQKDTEAQRPTYSWVGTPKPHGKTEREEKRDGGNERGESQRDWDERVESQRTTGCTGYEV